METCCPTCDWKLVDDWRRDPKTLAVVLDEGFLMASSDPNAEDSAWMIKYLYVVGESREQVGQRLVEMAKESLRSATLFGFSCLDDFVLRFWTKQGFEIKEVVEAKAYAFRAGPTTASMRRCYPRVFGDETGWGVWSQGMLFALAPESVLALWSSLLQSE